MGVDSHLSASDVASSLIGCGFGWPVVPTWSADNNNNTTKHLI